MGWFRCVCGGGGDATGPAPRSRCLERYGFQEWGTAAGSLCTYHRLPSSPQVTPQGPLSCPFPILCSSAPIWGTKSQRFRVEGHNLLNIQQQRGPEGSWESAPYCAYKPRRLHSHGFWLLNLLGELRATSPWFSSGRSLGLWVAFRKGMKESFSLKLL